jgi:putative endonuclease
LVPSELTVDRRKQAKIIRSTAMFLSWNEQYAALPLRFDVVAIDTNPRGEITVKWISDAFRPTNSRL